MERLGARAMLLALSSRGSHRCLGVLGLLLLVGCSSDPVVEQPPQQPAATPTGPDDLPVPKNGFQLKSVGGPIAPGEDVEYCEIAELPGDPGKLYYVDKIELANAPFSHHLVVATVVPGSPVDEKLRAMSVGDRIRCNGANYEWPEGGLLGLASAQTPYIALEFPDGVGTPMYGNQRIVFDYHYVNSSRDPIQAHSAFNVHLVEAVDHVVTAFSFYNFMLDVPARTSGSFVGECHFKNDLVLSRILRHTHQNGTDFSVWFSGGPRDGEHLWTSHDWKHDTDYVFPEPILMKAGEGFKFECDFDNQNDYRLRYGIRGTDEMCILAGWIWAADGRDLPTQDCFITWLDKQGVAHSAYESGGFPPASPSDAELCQAGVGLLNPSSGTVPGCNDCLCDSCGGILLRCATDKDCGPMLKCLGQQGCGTVDQCIQACEDVLHDHSSGTGMMQQVYQCMTSRCGMCGLQ